MAAVPFTDKNSLWADMEAGTASEWDIIVVGGGITGAGVLREAVRRGHKSLLIEQRDFAWGSSSRSSKMVHGGLRYLASGQFSLTRHSLLERERLLKEAPGLVNRLAYYYPLYKNTFPPRFAARFMFWLYDRIARIRDHRLVSNQQLKRVFEGLVTTNVKGAFYYTDAVTDDARLTLRTLHESVSAGGFVRNYTRATGLLKKNGRVIGLSVEDTQNGAKLDLRAGLVVNATGAWAERLRAGPIPDKRIRPQRGSHIVLSANEFPVRRAIYLLHPQDGRRLFLYPWEGRTIIGTTDIYHPRDLDIAASITMEELDYLLTAARPLFPGSPPGPEDVIATWSGVRPIVSSVRSRDPSKEGRDHQVWVEDGLLTCSGGKLTTFRYMALDVIRKAERFLPPGSEVTSDRVFSRPALKAMDLVPTDPGRGARLLGRYGDDAKTMLAEASGTERKTIGETAFCLAEVRWILQHESVVHLDDLMLRRTRLGLLMKNGGEAVLEDIKGLVVEVLHWNEQRWLAERERYREIIEKHYSVPAEG
jgi:glycerol-3-phosphate dehydrogenase